MQKTATTPAEQRAKRKGKTTASLKGASPLKSTVQQPPEHGWNAQRLGENEQGHAIGGLSYSVLTDSLASRSLFCIATEIDDRDKEGWVSIVDTERKQLKCISDLWAIVRAQPKYASLKKTDLKVTDDPLTVISWLMRKLAPLADGNKWCIDLRGGRYVFVVYRHFHSQEVRNDIEWIALDFLPVLAKKDKALHDLIVDLVALLHVRVALPLWDDDYYTGRALTWLLRKDTTNNTTRAEYQALYTTGEAGQYLRLIRDRVPIVTIEGLKKAVFSYTTETTRDGKELSRRKHFCLWWIRHGIDLAEWGRTIADFSFAPTWKGRSVAAEHLYRWMWDTSREDPLRMKFDTLIDQDYDIGRYSLPVAYSICRPGEVLQQLVEDRPPEELNGRYSSYVRHTFAGELCSFLRDGSNHFHCAEYQSYYCNIRAARKQFSIPLLSIFDRQELENEIRNS